MPLRNVLTCSNLETLILHEGIEEIDNVAFLGCAHLTRIVLPASLRQISESAFTNCQNLREIHMPADVQIYEDDMVDINDNGACAVRTGRGRVYMYYDPFVAQKQPGNHFKGCNRATVIYD